jgi:4-hydroxy-3-methylbut-2-enyl diphosphate reductase
MSQPTEAVAQPAQFFKKGLGLAEQVKEQLTRDYHSRVVEFIRSNGQSFRVNDLHFHLAKEFGFCYGVDRAVDYAYQTREKFPGRRIFLTGEIIHNPHVNRRMLEMGIRFLFGQYAEVEGYDQLTPEDVVILPAFGVPHNDLKRLAALGCILVDTTCGSVLNVWKRVEQYAREGFTSVIHGKYSHEETKATSSQATKYAGGHYLIVRDMEQAEKACDFIAGRWPAEVFMKYFANSVSNGFNPEKHLQKIGVANQTTMLSSESLAIAARLRRAIAEKYGEENVDAHFRTFDTICSATQERQDAVIELIKRKLDVMLIIGGYNSSNTTHLAEISSEHARTFHIDDAACLLSLEAIRHQPVMEHQEITTHEWLPPGEVHVGLTAGASTPNNKIGEAIERIVRLRGEVLEQWMK